MSNRNTDIQTAETTEGEAIFAAARELFLKVPPDDRLHKLAVDFAEWMQFDIGMSQGRETGQ